MPTPTANTPVISAMALDRAKGPTIKEQVADRILDRSGPNGEVITTHPDFENWLNRPWPSDRGQRFAADHTDTKATIRDQATAKAMLSSFIEERLKAQDGVWFGMSDTQFTLGLKGRQPILVDCPAWMTAFIRTFPKLRRPFSPEEVEILMNPTGRASAEQTAPPAAAKRSLRRAA